MPSFCWTVGHVNLEQTKFNKGKNAHSTNQRIKINHVEFQCSRILKYRIEMQHDMIDPSRRQTILYMWGLVHKQKVAAALRARLNLKSASRRLFFTQQTFLACWSTSPCPHFVPMANCKDTPRSDHWSVWLLWTYYAWTSCVAFNMCASARNVIIPIPTRDHLRGTQHVFNCKERDQPPRTPDHEVQETY